MATKIKTIIFFFMLWGTTGLLPPGNLTDAAEERSVRIAVLKGVDNFVVSARGQFQIIDPQSEAVLREGRKLKKSKVKFVENSIAIGRNLYKISTIRIIPQKDVALYINGKRRRYKGIIDIFPEKDKTFTVVNALELETYIRGVLYHEVTDRWPMEALKAQAIAARTYALYQTDVNQKQKYDLTSDVYSQVYGGKSAERYRTNIAVEKTNGMVLTYKNKIIPAYFHSNSGGHTEDAGELWKHDLTPLKGKVDQYAAGIPAYSWAKNFRSSDIQKKLESHDHKIGLIKEIKITERTKSGRVKLLSIIDRGGKVLQLSGNAFRAIVGPNDMRSNLFDIQMEGYFFDVTGKGWGHGVGMSQWGAYHMAKERFKFDEILKYYYPGIKIKDLDRL